MKIYIATAFATLSFGLCAQAGVPYINCTSDTGLTLNVATDVDSAELGTASDYASITRFQNDNGTLSRKTSEIRGTYTIERDASEKIKTISLDAGGIAPTYKWIVSIKKIRLGINFEQNVYEGRYSEMKFEDAAWSESNFGAIVCID
jgi:hypothetical protein